MKEPQRSDDPYGRLGVRHVINAAGKLTALGGSAQSAEVASAQAAAARTHVDLVELRRAAGALVASATGAEAASVTPGAAAGIAIGVAALITGTDTAKVERVPDTEGLANHVLLQAGHDVNFGAPVVQMIRLGGGRPVIVGTREAVRTNELAEALAGPPTPAALLYVQSHHCLQQDRVPLEECIRLAHEARVPVLVDAAAEEDLRRYIDVGADLVTYSGGKAIGGPTCGFIAGRRVHVDACELQQRGIARAMKVGKEQIAGLVAALDRYGIPDSGAHDAHLVKLLVDALAGIPEIEVFVKPDEAGRPIERVAIRPRTADPVDLVRFLEADDPSIRTRNHQLKHGLLLVDPREMTTDQAYRVAERIHAYFRDAKP